MHHSLISVNALNGLLKKSYGSADVSLNKLHNLKILFTTMKSGPAERPQLVKEALNTYIPHSIFFDFQNEFVEPETPFSHTMPNAKLFESKARQLGLNNEDEIVVYDDFGNFCASRVWFMFRSVGFKNIKVLDGGLALWLKANYPTHSSLVKETQNGNFIASKDVYFGFVNKAFILQNIDSKQHLVVDARSKARFTGCVAESRPNLRPGHIPHSKNLHYAELFDDLGQFLPTEELQIKFKNFEDNLIFSCGSGVTACLLAQAAHIIGRSPLLVYDGSWSEWGADATLPIEQGE